MVCKNLQVFDLNFIHLFYLPSKNCFSHQDNAFVFFDIMNTDKSTAFMTPMTEVATVFPLHADQPEDPEHRSWIFGRYQEVPGIRVPEKFQMIHGQVHFICFTKSNTRVKNDLVIDAGVRAILTHSWVSASMSTRKLLYSVLSLLCIRQQGYIMSGNDRSHFRIVFQSPDIIDKICPLFQGFFCNTSLVCIYRNRDIETAS